MDLNANEAQSGEVVHRSAFRSRNRNLQWLRALAAAFVLLYHTSVYLHLTEVGDSFYKVFDDKFGLLGVAIFFAISGALMADLVKTTSPAKFLLHRVVRIYPIFLICYALVPVAINHRITFDIRAALLFPVGDNAHYSLAVEWTLLFEISYYVFLYFCALTGLQKRIELVGLIWLILTVVATVLTPSLQNTLVPKIYVVPVLAANAAFAGGLLIPWLARHNVFQPATAFAAVGLGLITMAFPLGIGRLIGAAVAVLVVGLAISPRPASVEVAPTGRFERIATKYGDWSYALYLCHVPLLLAVYFNFGKSWPIGLLWATALILPLLACVPIGMLDLRLYRFLRKRVDRLSDRQSNSWAAAYAILFVVITTVFAFKGS